MSKKVNKKYGIRKNDIVMYRDDAYKVIGLVGTEILIIWNGHDPYEIVTPCDVTYMRDYDW